MFVFLLLTGCPTPDLIANPTGSCEAADDGARTCYHNPVAGDQYLPDCDPPLKRELWRVFAQSNDTSYVIPRPDGDRRLAELCVSDDAELLGLLNTYTLCGTPNIDKINAMKPADALVVTHALHERLDFEAVDYGSNDWGLDPWVPDTDLIDACALNTDPELDAICAAFVPRAEGESCPDMAIMFDETEARGLAELLDELYGVP